jgi:hypothetical protein
MGEDPTKNNYTAVEIFTEVVKYVRTQQFMDDLTNLSVDDLQEDVDYTPFMTFINQKMRLPPDYNEVRRAALGTQCQLAKLTTIITGLRPHCNELNPYQLVTKQLLNTDELGLKNYANLLDFADIHPLNKEPMHTGKQMIGVNFLTMSKKLLFERIVIQRLSKGLPHMRKAFGSVEENRKYAQGISIRESFPAHWKDDLTIIKNRMNVLRDNDDRLIHYKVKNMRNSLGLTITTQIDDKKMCHNINQDFVKNIDDDDLNLTLDVMMCHVFESYPLGSKQKGRREHRKAMKGKDKTDSETDKAKDIEREKRKQENTSTDSFNSSKIINPTKQFKTADDKNISGQTDASATDMLNVSSSDIANFDQSVSGAPTQTSTPS